MSNPLTQLKFKPLTKGKDLKYGIGCKWLGKKYLEHLLNKFDISLQESKKYITKDIVLQGILDEQKLWYPESKYGNRGILLKNQ